MKREEVTDRRQLIIYLLLELHKANKLIPFGDLFFQSGYAQGLDSFKDVLEEMHRKGWVNKFEEDGGPIDGLPVFARKVDLRYGISIDGYEYLASIGKVEDKHPTPKDKTGMNNISLTGDKNRVNVVQGSPESSLSAKDSPRRSSSGASTVMKALIALAVTVIGGLLVWYLTQRP
ncbi:MAG TPA: hypothetical protein PL070_18590 [Flavobacteriales bacterium]|nr:hypothetical protein [Flavobacteriales bacterium]